MQVSKWIRIFLAVIGSILFLDGLFLAFLNKIHVGTLVPLVLGAFFCLYALFYYYLERSLAFWVVVFLDLVNWLRLFF